MKRSEYFAVVSLVAIIIIALAAIVSLTGCVHRPVVTNGVTNIVTTIDPVKLAQAQAAITPAVSSVLRRAILNSPQHSQQIGDYARAVGKVFYFVKSSGRFSPSEVIVSMDAATQGLQSTAPPEVIDGKNTAIALYIILFDDKLTVNVPGNGWPMAVCTLFYSAIDQALRDAGQAGIQ